MKKRELEILLVDDDDDAARVSSKRLLNRAEG